MRGVARSYSYAETADVSMISSEVLWEPQQVSGVGIFAMTNEIHPAINKKTYRVPNGLLGLRLLGVYGVRTVFLSDWQVIQGSET